VVAAVICLLVSVLHITVSHAIGTLITVDQAATEIDLNLLERYFDFEKDSARIYTAAFGSLKIFRLESSKYCADRRCLTLVVAQCGNKTCPHVFVVAENTVFNSDMYANDVLGGSWIYAFGDPGRPSMVIAVGKGFLAVVPVPSQGRN